MLYDANHSGQYRVGYVDGSKIKGNRPTLSQLVWDGSTCDILETVSVTDDPAQTGRALTTLPAGTRVTYLTTMYNDQSWDYIETTIEGQVARGFIPTGYLSMTGVDETEKDEPGEG